MELMIPTHADTGSTKLVWSLDAAFEGEAPSTAVTSISITGGSNPAGHVACDPSSRLMTDPAEPSTVAAATMARTVLKIRHSRPRATAARRRPAV
jgi:hypothetical protein